MTSIETTAFAALDKEGRLLNAVFKGPTGKPGYYGFRGDIALKFQPKLADEARPPEFKLEQIVAIAKEGTGKIEKLAGYLTISPISRNLQANRTAATRARTAPISSSSTTSTCWRNTRSPSMARP